MKKIILALDVPDADKALALVKTLAPWVDLYKIGPILFLSDGQRLVREIRALGKEVFLDLKFHDIPATVERSVASAQMLGVYSLTIHSSGGEEMIRAAVKPSPRPRIWAVTVLTSQKAAPEEVVARALLAKKNGANGVIASPLEIDLIKKACGREFEVITPGIRIEDRKDDQKRVATPLAAVKAGADFIVIGRPILEASDPVEVARRISLEISEL